MNEKQLSRGKYTRRVEKLWNEQRKFNHWTVIIKKITVSFFWETASLVSQFPYFGEDKPCFTVSFIGRGQALNYGFAHWRGQALNYGFLRGEGQALFYSYDHCGIANLELRFCSLGEGKPWITVSFIGKGQALFYGFLFLGEGKPCFTVS
jgi:hypothetical protein